MLISLTDWAKKHNISNSAARRKATDGILKSAVKIGRIWLIDSDEPNIDNRIKSGKYIKK